MNRRELFGSFAALLALPLLPASSSLAASETGTIYGVEAFLAACRRGPVIGRTIVIYSNLLFENINVLVKDCKMELHNGSYFVVGDNCEVTLDLVSLSVYGSAVFKKAISEDHSRIAQSKYRFQSGDL